MPKHVYHKCTDPDCSICISELDYCTVCGGSDIDLTTECYGMKLNSYILEAIHSGGLDYKNGEWSVDGRQ